MGDRGVRRSRAPLLSLADDGAYKDDVTTWKVFRSTYERLLKLPPQARRASSASTPSCTRKLILQLALASGPTALFLSRPLMVLSPQALRKLIDASLSHPSHLLSIFVSPSRPMSLSPPLSLAAILASSSRSGAPVRAARARELSRPKAERTRSCGKG